MLCVFLKLDVKTFKETVYLLLEYVAEDSMDQLYCLARFVHQAHAILRLYRGRL